MAPINDTVNKIDSLLRANYGFTMQNLSMAFEDDQTQLKIIYASTGPPEPWLWWQIILMTLAIVFAVFLIFGCVLELAHESWEEVREADSVKTRKEEGKGEELMELRNMKDTEDIV